jgi:ABC-type antimicrobial peptide transport system permease subunit
VQAVFVNVSPTMESMKVLSVSTIFVFRVSRSSTSEDRGLSLKEILSRYVIVLV